MVRSDSADEEINIEKYDDLEECIEDEYPPQPRWSSQHANAGNRPHSRATSSLSPTASDPDRRLRRQIANCNERRRMQSINAGFQSLRALLPRKLQEGEKLSKAAILQQTADLIHTMQAERQRLLDSEGAGGKKAKLDSDYNDIEQRAMIDRLQVALERERSSRMFLEQQVNQLREQLCYQAQFSPASPPSVPPSAAAAAVQQQQQQRQVGVVSPQQPPPHQQSPPLVGQGGHQEVASVIRPTPLPPISVDVTQRCTNPTSLTSSPLTMSAAAAAPALVSSAPSAFTQSSSTAAHRSLQTILDAIRHLEGGHVLAAHSPPPTSQATVVR